MLPKVVRTIPELRAETAKWKKEGLASAVVPTMGALHDGHITLVREGLKRAPRAVTTIFVNPTQFSANEDLSRYPRDEQGDLTKLAEAGCHLVFAPSPAIVYPEGFATRVLLEGPATVGLEDRFRPHFFGGVATVVAKLFNQTQADFAMFGEKDYQQLRVVTQMARDLDIPIEVVGVPTIREKGGLAMSSRNAYLSTEERMQATAIIRTLRVAADKIRNGGALEAATSAAEKALEMLGFKVDYVAARNAGTLAEPQSSNEPLRLLAAATIGRTRLIDNIPV